jgi:hypothetical protein
MTEYQDFLLENMVDYEYPAARIEAGMERVPVVAG